MRLTTPGVLASCTVALVGALCLVLVPYLPWLGAWPKGLTFPATAWIGTGLTWFFELIKPAARLVSALLAYPMGWANVVLVSSPYTLVIGVFTAVGWYVGGWRIAALAFVGLGLVLLSGYWVASMNTLALVFVSVPLALLIGAAIGIAANEVAAVNRVVQTALDIMQTVPTFAYLTPLLLLFGFGSVVGLIASVIYAAPPMARNMILALQRVEPEIREAAIMSGATRRQQLFLVEIPSVSRQIMVGVNQTIMASLSMVIIAAVIGGFNDIGWEVLLNMRKAAFGQSLIAGLVIVVFAILLDRMSSALACEGRSHSAKVAGGILIASVAIAFLEKSILPAPGTFAAFKGTAAFIDSHLGAFIGANGAAIDGVKNGAMFYVLLPLRVGLAQAILPFTWGFQWTTAMSIGVYVAAGLIALAVVARKEPVIGISILIAAGVLVTGVTNLPWPFVLVGFGALGWVAGGPKLAAYAVILVAIVPLMGLWEPALLSLYLSGAAVIACVVIGGVIGILCGVSDRVWAVFRPICDLLQTIPLFVLLIPVLMLFQIGEFSAFLAICAYGVAPMIRYTREGLVSTPEELVEAAISSGATEWQMLWEVRAPYAAPTILLGLNQTILYAFSMLVIAALVGTTDLGQQIYLALGQGDVGLGVAAGISMALLALVADRIVQAFAERQRTALGL